MLFFGRCRLIIMAGAAFSSASALYQCAQHPARACICYFEGDKYREYPPRSTKSNSCRRFFLPVPI